MKIGIDNILVYFDEPEARYKGGAKLSGKIVVVVDKPTQIRAIKLQISGNMRIYWRKMDGNNTLEFSEHEEYLDEDLKVWATKDKWTYSGQHEYPFNYELPVDLPSSLDNDSRYANIHYVTRASVHLPKGVVMSSLEKNFFIDALPEPECIKQKKKEEERLLKKRLKLLQNEEDEDDDEEEDDEIEDANKPKLFLINYAYATIGNFFFGKTKIELSLKLDKSYYDLGEKMPCHVECRVEGGHADVDAISAILVQEAVYTVNKGTKEEAKNKEVIVYASATDKEDVDEGEYKKFTLYIDIPKDIPLSGFPWCDSIDMAYYVHVVARTHYFYDDVVVKVPIVLK